MKTYNQTMRYAARAFGRGVRVMAALDIGRARTRCQELQGSIQTARSALAEHRQSGTGSEQELQALRDQIARETAEYSDLIGAVRGEESRQAANVAHEFARRSESRGSMMDAIGGYFRAVMTRSALPQAIVSALSGTVTIGANPGNGLLPVTVSGELIGDIYDDGGFLGAITVTSIPGLRLPKAATAKTSTTAALADGAQATEHTMTPDSINFGRFPGRDVIGVPSAVLRGTNVDLAGYITAKLQEIHRERLYARALATNATGDYAHMSVYNAAVGITSVSGATTYEAIINALAALPLAARRAAKVLMTSAAYFGMIKELANGATPLFGGIDQTVLGFEVVLCENASTIVVGDLKAIHVNYDDALGMTSDENVRTGVTDTVIYGDYDIQITDANRLRLATVSA